MENSCEKLIILSGDKEFLDNTLDLKEEFESYCNARGINTVYVVKTGIDREGSVYIKNKNRYDTETFYVSVGGKETANIGSIESFVEEIKDTTTHLVVVTRNEIKNLVNCQHLSVLSLIEDMAQKGIITKKRAEEVRKNL